MPLSMCPGTAKPSAFQKAASEDVSWRLVLKPCWFCILGRSIIHGTGTEAALTL